VDFAIACQSALWSVEGTRRAGKGTSTHWMLFSRLSLLFFKTKKLFKIMIIHLRQIPTRRKIRIPLILKMEKIRELSKTQGQKIKK